MKVQIFVIALLCLGAVVRADLADDMVTKLTKYQKFAADQVTNARLIMKACVPYTTDKRHLAYILSTAIGECDLRLIKEKKAAEGTKLWDLQKRYWYTGYYGRGFMQITWKEVYERFGKILGIDLVGNPDLALKPDVAATIICMGMKKGLFTGVKLDTYFNDQKSDWFNARRIINILDKAQIFADRGIAIYNA